VSRNGDQLSVFSFQFSVKNKVQLVLTDNGHNGRLTTAGRTRKTQRGSPSSLVSGLPKE